MSITNIVSAHRKRAARTLTLSGAGLEARSPHLKPTRGGKFKDP